MHSLSGDNFEYELGKYSKLIQQVALMNYYVWHVISECVFALYVPIKILR